MPIGGSGASHRPPPVGPEGTVSALVYMNDQLDTQDLSDAISAQRLGRAHRHHHALLLDEKGRKLAKRRGSPAIADYRMAGEDGLGWVDKLRTAQWPCGISLGKAHI